MLVFGIESSCDETAFALLEDGKKVISECVASQISIHQPYGGVVPELAARSHLQASMSLFCELWSKAQQNHKIDGQDIDLIAVTAGPGLMGSLLVGAEIAKGLAMSLNVPIIRVNHVLAHVHGIFLKLPTPPLPALSYVISGGHSHLFYMNSPTSFSLVAQTIDDACGECFDKVAHMLQLPYPGGPHLEKLAQKGDPHRFTMPTMIKEKHRLELSYSGLKTYVFNLLRQLRAESSVPLDMQTYADIAAAFQQEAFLQLVRKLDAALIQYPDVKAVYVSGGVACNQALRQMFDHHFSKRMPTYFPDPSLCTDNAQMIASLGYHQVMDWIHQGNTLQDLYASSFNWEPFSRFSCPKTSTQQS